MANKFAAKRLENLHPYLFAELDRRKEELEARGHDVISLGIGDPDMPTFPRIVNAMIEAVQKPENHRYPVYAGSAAFRGAVSTFMERRFGLDIDPATEVCALIGSKEGIANLYPAFVDTGAYALLPGVGYPVYDSGAILNDSQVYYMPMTKENGYLADFESAPADVVASAQLMLISYPNNPTSAIAPVEYFDKAIAFAREHGLLLINDNAYCDIAFEGYVPPSILQRPGARDVCIELFSTSKSYNMTGWRCAFAVGNAEAINTYKTVKSNIDSGIFTAIQEAAIEAITGPQAETHAMAELYQQRRDLVMAAFDDMGIEYAYPHATMFMWGYVPEGYTSAEFAEKVLTEAHVIIAPGNAYGPSGEGYFRVTLACPNDRLAEALERMKKLDW